ncbi:hypothetical protein H4219_004200 [Mycoemilia scoparia]|uniref:Uncharacterized protein n=1 Tax=Mycoemilia scoparia TaxID=417184 RepID=A0A9W8A1X9_9FUNG|nr:hypothetical protein H4219_004200 [Mycoemilia scoparia]
MAKIINRSIQILKTPIIFTIQSRPGLKNSLWTRLQTNRFAVLKYTTNNQPLSPPPPSSSSSLEEEEPNNNQSEDENDPSLDSNRAKYDKETAIRSLKMKYMKSDTLNEAIQKVRLTMRMFDKKDHNKFVNELEKMWKSKPVSTIPRDNMRGLKRLSLFKIINHDSSEQFRDTEDSTDGSRGLDNDDDDDDDDDEGMGMDMNGDNDYDDDEDIENRFEEDSDGEKQEGGGSGSKSRSFEMSGYKDSDALTEEEENELIEAFMDYFKLYKVNETPELLKRRNQMRKMYPDLFGDITDEELKY